MLTYKLAVENRDEKPSQIGLSWRGEEAFAVSLKQTFDRETLLKFSNALRDEYSLSLSTLQSPTLFRVVLVEHASKYYRDEDNNRKLRYVKMPYRCDSAGESTFQIFQCNGFRLFDGTSHTESLYIRGNSYNIF